MIIGTLLPLFAKSKGLKTKEDFLKEKAFNKDDIASICKGNDGKTFSRYLDSGLYWDENQYVSLNIDKISWNEYNYVVRYYINNWKDSIYKQRAVYVKNKQEALTVVSDIYKNHNIELKGEQYIQQFYGQDYNLETLMEGTKKGARTFNLTNDTFLPQEKIGTYWGDVYASYDFETDAGKGEKRTIHIFIGNNDDSSMWPYRVYATTDEGESFRRFVYVKTKQEAFDVFFTFILNKDRLTKLTHFLGEHYYGTDYDPELILSDTPEKSFFVRTTDEYFDKNAGWNALGHHLYVNKMVLNMTYVGENESRVSYILVFDSGNKEYPYTVQWFVKSATGGATKTASGQAEINIQVKNAKQVFDVMEDILGKYGSRADLLKDIPMGKRNYKFDVDYDINKMFK